MSQKQVMPKSEDLSRSLEINAIWTFDTEFPTIFNKSCTYITFKSAVKHRQLFYGYPPGQIVHLVEATTQDTYSSIKHMYTSIKCYFVTHVILTHFVYTIRFLKTSLKMIHRPLMDILILN